MTVELAMTLIAQAMDAWTWGLAGVGAIGALTLVVALIGDRSRGRRRCPRCWYSLDGVPGLVCPECGRDAKRERRLTRTRRRWRVAIVGVLLLLAAAAGHFGRIAKRDGVWVAVPFDVCVHLAPWYTEIPQALEERVYRRLMEGPIAEWRRGRLYARMGSILESGARLDSKKFALRAIEGVSWRGGYNGAPTGEAYGAAPTLIAALDDPHPDIRGMALALLGTIGGDPNPTLVAAVPMIDTDVDVNVRRQAVGVLSRLGDAPAVAGLDVVPRIRRGYLSGDKAFKFWAISAAGKVGKTRPDAVGWLREVLDEGDRTFTGSVCAEFRGLGPLAASAVPSLVTLVSTNDRSEGAGGATALRAIGDTSEPVRSVLLASVRRISGFDEAFDAIAWLFKDDPAMPAELDNATRWWTTKGRAFAAAEACNRGAKPATMVRFLEPAIRTMHSRQEELSWTDVYRWAFIGESRDVTLLPFLEVPSVPNYPGDVWRIALKARIAGNDASALEPIATVLTLDAKMVMSSTRAAAAETLGRLGALSRTKTPLLEPLLKDDSWDVRSRAREAIERITGAPPPEAK